MLIVIYKDEIPTINTDYYHNVIAPNISRLAILLDYDTVKEKYEN